CLVASTEVIRKLPDFGRLPHGYGCIAIDNVNDIGALAGALAAIVREPELTMVVGQRGRAFAQEMQRDIDFPGAIENILEAAPRRQKISDASEPDIDEDAEAHNSRFLLTELAATALGRTSQTSSELAVQRKPSEDIARARDILSALRRLPRAADLARL